MLAPPTSCLPQLPEEEVPAAAGQVPQWHSPSPPDQTPQEACQEEGRLELEPLAVLLHHSRVIIGFISFSYFMAGLAGDRLALYII